MIKFPKTTMNKRIGHTNANLISSDIMPKYSNRSLYNPSQTQQFNKENNITISSFKSNNTSLHHPQPKKNLTEKRKSKNNINNNNNPSNSKLKDKNFEDKTHIVLEFFQFKGNNIISYKNSSQVLKSLTNFNGYFIVKVSQKDGIEIVQLDDRDTQISNKNEMLKQNGYKYKNNYLLQFIPYEDKTHIFSTDEKDEIEEEKEPVLLTRNRLKFDSKGLTSENSINTVDKQLKSKDNNTSSFLQQEDSNKNKQQDFLQNHREKIKENDNNHPKDNNNYYSFSSLERNINDLQFNEDKIMNNEENINNNNHYPDNENSNENEKEQNDNQDNTFVIHEYKYNENSNTDRHGNDNIKNDNENEDEMSDEDNQHFINYSHQSKDDELIKIGRIEKLEGIHPSPLRKEEEKEKGKEEEEEENIFQTKEKPKEIQNRITVDKKPVEQAKFNEIKCRVDLKLFKQKMNNFSYKNIHFEKVKSLKQLIIGENKEEELPRTFTSRAQLPKKNKIDLKSYSTSHSVTVKNKFNKISKNSKIHGYMSARFSEKK